MWWPGTLIIEVDSRKRDRRGTVGQRVVKVGVPRAPKLVSSPFYIRNLRDATMMTVSAAQGHHSSECIPKVSKMVKTSDCED